MQYGSTSVVRRLLPKATARRSRTRGLGPSDNLVVDDEADIVELLVVLFEQVGFRCVGARTVEEGLDRLRQAAFDVVLADYSLPNPVAFTPTLVH
jgi:PleD family two-component response regulator